MLIAIDAGKDGALAARWETGRVVVMDTPVVKAGSKTEYDEREMRKLLVNWSGQSPPTVVIETTNARPGQAVNSTWMQAAGIYLWRGIVIGLDWPYQVVYPQTWTKVVWAGFQPPTKGMTKAERSKARKLASYKAACQLYPQLADQLKGPKGGLKDGRSDALCILEWARRTLVK